MQITIRLAVRMTGEKNICIQAVLVCFSKVYSYVVQLGKYGIFDKHFNKYPDI
jgi:hypothetical protein